jgi:hypothetical protein
VEASTHAVTAALVRGVREHPVSRLALELFDRRRREVLTAAST